MGNKNNKTKQIEANDEESNIKMDRKYEKIELDFERKQKLLIEGYIAQIIDNVCNYSQDINGLIIAYIKSNEYNKITWILTNESAKEIIKSSPSYHDLKFFKFSHKINNADIIDFKFKIIVKCIKGFFDCFDITKECTVYFYLQSINELSSININHILLYIEVKYQYWDFRDIIKISDIDIADTNIAKNIGYYSFVQKGDGNIFGDDGNRDYQLPIKIFIDPLQIIYNDKINKINNFMKLISIKKCFSFNWTIKNMNKSYQSETFNNYCFYLQYEPSGIIDIFCNYMPQNVVKLKMKIQIDIKYENTMCTMNHFENEIIIGHGYILEELKHTKLYQYKYDKSSVDTNKLNVTFEIKLKILNVWNVNNKQIEMKQWKQYNIL